MYTYFVKSVDRIVDGDTIDISIDLGFDLTKKERVRLAGIDTPETRTKESKRKRMGLPSHRVFRNASYGSDKAYRKD